MELINEVLILALDSNEKVGKYLTEEGSWLGMTALAAMLAFVIYWGVWNVENVVIPANKKKKEEKRRIEEDKMRWESDDWVLKNGEWVHTKEDKTQCSILFGCRLLQYLLWRK